MKRKICFITGTRAEYGILSHLMQLVEDDKDLQLQIIATNMHLSPQYGLTYKEIEADGFTIDKKVNMLISGDTSNATAKSMGLASIGFADALEDLNPDLIVILGDRYEMLSAASVALVFRIPIAHLHGGEVTEGAYDDAIRHSITKMSHLHFTSTEEYRNRVIQLGEDPNRVFNVGALGVENIKNTPLLTKSEFEDSIHFKVGEKSLLVTYHPVTLASESPKEQIENLLKVLDKYSEYKIIFTLPNSDTNGHIIADLINEYAAKDKNRISVYASLGKLRYLSALKYVSAVIGNSSSGIIEVPSFGIPTLNIGDRQKGRLAATSVVNCGTSQEAIERGMEYILSKEFENKTREVLNPYEKRETSRTILEYFKNYPLDNIVSKTFYNLNNG